MGEPTTTSSMDRLIPAGFNSLAQSGPMIYVMTQEPAPITAAHSTPSSVNTGPLPNAEEYDPYGQVAPVPTIQQVMNMPNGDSAGSTMNGENTGNVVNGENTGNMMNGENMGNMVNGENMGNMVNGENTGNMVNGEITGNAMNGDNTGPPPNEDEAEYNPYLPAVLPTVPAVALVTDKRRGENSGPLPNQDQIGYHPYPVPMAHVANNLGANGMVPPMSPGPPPYVEVQR